MVALVFAGLLARLASTASPAHASHVTVAVAMTEAHEQHPTDEQNPDPVRCEEVRHLVLFS
jgi:hypothetical protein